MGAVPLKSAIMLTYLVCPSYSTPAESVRFLLGASDGAHALYCGEVTVRGQLLLTAGSLARHAAKLASAPALAAAKYGMGTVTVSCVLLTVIPGGRCSGWCPYRCNVCVCVCVSVSVLLCFYVCVCMCVCARPCGRELACRSAAVPGQGGAGVDAGGSLHRPGECVCVCVFRTRGEAFRLPLLRSVRL